MFKDDEITINGHSSNYLYYRNLGYSVDVRKPFLIKTKDLMRGSVVKIVCICSNCNRESNNVFKDYWSYTNGLKDVYYCKKCKFIKARVTCIEKYGVDNPMKSDICKKSLKDTLMERYGVDHYSKTDEYKEKYKKTCIGKYGVDNVSKYLPIKKIISDLKFKEHDLIVKFSSMLSNDYKIKSYDSDRNFIIYHERCDSHFNIFAGTINDRMRNKNIICINCNPLDQSVSSSEIELRDFILENITDIVTNSYKIVSPFSLDIYIPEKKLAIEYNGVYWHSELHRDKNYHLNKTNLCNKLGIDLIHVWEDDWLMKPEIVKSIILDRLDIIRETIDISECHIIEINRNDVIIDYLNKNQINGYFESDYNIGLFHINELVGLMSFSKVGDEFEMLNCCYKINLKIDGSFSLLFNYFINKYQISEVITHTDVSMFTGMEFKLFGFIEIDFISPNHMWVVGSDRKKFSNLDIIKYKNIKDINNKSEFEIMKELGYYRIWNCGTKKWKWKRHI